MTRAYPLPKRRDSLPPSRDKSARSLVAGTALARFTSLACCHSNLPICSPFPSELAIRQSACPPSSLAALAFPTELSKRCLSSSEPSKDSLKSAAAQDRRSCSRQKERSLPAESMRAMTIPRWTFLILPSQAARAARMRRMKASKATEDAKFAARTTTPKRSFFATAATASFT